MNIELIINVHESAKPVQLYQFMHWWEIGKDISTSRPEVNPLSPLAAFPFTEEWQWFAFGLLENQSNGQLTQSQLIQAFNSIYSSTTAFCNDQGVESNRNYITGDIYSEHQLLPLPKIFPIICGGNVVTGEEVVVKNVRYLRIEHLGGMPPDLDDVSRATYPWFVQYATIITTHKLDNDGYVVNRFAQMHGLDVPVPIVGQSDVDYLYPLSNLRKLPLGSSAPSPYNP